MILADTRSDLAGRINMNPFSLDQLKTEPLPEALSGMPDGAHKSIYLEWLKYVRVTSIPSPFPFPAQILAKYFDWTALINVERFGADASFRVLVAGDIVSSWLDSYSPDSVFTPHFYHREYGALTALYSRIEETRSPFIIRNVEVDGLWYTQSAMPIYNSKNEIIQLLCAFEF